MQLPNSKALTGSIHTDGITAQAQRKIKDKTLL